jgi:cold shock CspA family protein
MRGSITQVSGDGSGCILAEDGNEVYFERSGISGSSVDDLKVGHWVEFELQHGCEELHAVGIKRLRRDVERRPEAPQPHG